MPDLQAIARRVVEILRDPQMVVSNPYNLCEPVAVDISEAERFCVVGAVMRAADEQGISYFEARSVWSRPFVCDDPTTALIDHGAEYCADLIAGWWL